MRPFLSVVVVSYNMDRELPRTLYSMSPKFQRDIDRDGYEVILVDNGSKNPPRIGDFDHLEMNLSIHCMENPTHSPVAAINFGINQSCGKFIGVCIDGARMVSPGLFNRTLEALSLGDRFIVGARGRYLGTKFQRDAILEGYDAAKEDSMLEQSRWTENGYGLFDISVFDESCGPTWFTPIAESNAIFMSRQLWKELDGFDPAFTSKGGGLVNLDVWSRALLLPDTQPLLLLGEATFHQVHGGVATNGTHETIREFYDEYRQIRGHDYEIPSSPVSLYGHFHHQPRGSELHPRDSKSQAGSRDSRIRRVGSRTLGRRLPTGLRNRLRPVLDLISATVNTHPRRGLRLLREELLHEKVIAASPYFNATWYETQYPDVRQAGYRAALHYVRFGAKQLRQPGPNFDAVWYLDVYEDVATSGMNPLIHYIVHGKKEGRRRRWMPEVLMHANASNGYDTQLAIETVRNSSLFDEAWYLDTYPDVRQAGRDAATHYALEGGFEGRDPGPAFSSDDYLTTYPDVKDAEVNPLVHFETHGRSEGRVHSARSSS